MRITQGAFSFLPDLTEDQIRRQIDYCRGNGWAVSVEFADDVQARATAWAMWGRPLLDTGDAARVMAEIRACRAAHPRQYVRINAFDAGHGGETVRLSFIINRPREDSGFRQERGDLQGRTMRYRNPPALAARAAGARH